MATFTKYNNPSRKHRQKRLNRTDADILAAKRMFDDRSRGCELPLSAYDELSDRLCGKPSRNIYQEKGENLK